MTRSKKTDDAKVYEIGYLLVSSIPVEKIEAKVNEIKAILSSKKAEMIGEETPVLETLAYTMIKKVGAINHRFTEGYFGWVKFAVMPADINDIKIKLDADTDVLRFILMNVPRDTTYLGKRAPTAASIIKDEVVVVEAEAVAEPVVDETPKEA